MARRRAGVVGPNGTRPPGHAKTFRADLKEYRLWATQGNGPPAFGENVNRVLYFFHLGRPDASGEQRG